MLQKLIFFDFAVRTAPIDDKNYAAPYWLLNILKMTYSKAYRNDRAIYYPKQNMRNLTFVAAFNTNFSTLVVYRIHKNYHISSAW